MVGTVPIEARQPSQLLIDVAKLRDALRVVDDPGAEALDLEAYARRIERRLDAGVARPADLVGRVVSRERHREEWIARCRDLER